ncbi:MAG: outer membrane beta-barrel protein [Cyclobacteriaceae bacterium]|nr:outer membrane beta-barrel protein [Cyclobacteriaceae bacterium]
MKKSTATIIFNLLIFSLLFANVYAQEATPKNSKATRATKLITEKAGRPDIPGDLIIEFGFNWMQDHPSGYGFNTMKSRTFNAYYLYDINIGKSSFSVHPGLGIGTEKYAFKSDYTIGYGIDAQGEKEMQFVPLDSIYGLNTDFKKSQINPNYFDIPLEIRWRSNKYDPKSSIKVTLGGKFGVLFDSKTKVKYEADGEKKTDKDKQSFELNTLRYGTYVKLGVGGFSAYYYYSISEVFKKDKGPMGTTMYPMTFGLSLALF